MIEIHIQGCKEALVDLSLDKTSTRVEQTADFGGQNAKGYTASDR